ncbi:uncharacterized protein SAPINGB_P004336 [Magnusiomyces paraingens]|uniref:Amino acid permease/ SLC12A domain-containing protein n=1 Tax=Magnusiomyces paraingens TaxID=2606893 RepID=A0A5E8C1E0_9ASCO|nr:uncharacterized protein SAPINGB_P004336 [Saprochaete ingens]VVT54935.1 unnamed protein product [Saprochaete ingens]
MTDKKDTELTITSEIDAASQNIDGANQEIDPDSGVRRGLKTRHLSMMALAGIIGPGVLSGFGGVLPKGGPIAVLIGFGVVGLLAYSVTQSVGEMTTIYPTGGAFMTLAERFGDKALSFAIGWYYFIIWVTVLANEYNITTSTLNFWTDKIPIWGWFLIIWFLFLAFQLLGVEAFGESEYWLALIKIIALTVYFLFALIYMCGGVKGTPAFGFQYWRNPGPFSNGFRGVANVFIYCSTYYAGVESVAIAATETRNPSKAVPLAVRQVFWRIIFVYMGCAFFYGVTVPYNSPELSGSSRAIKSPITIALANAGWAGGIHLVNAFILVTCLSAVNSSIYIGSRTILFMAHDGTAPKILGYTNKRGVPVYAIVLTNLFGAIALLNVSEGAMDAFGYIVNISGVATFLVWGAISFVHLRFRAAWKHNGLTKEDIPFQSILFPWNAYFGLGFSMFLAFVQGWSTLSPFSYKDFIDAYLMLPLFPIFYIVYKLVFKTKFKKLDEIDVFSGRRKDVGAYHDVEQGDGANIEAEDDSTFGIFKTGIKKVWNKM